MPQSLSTTGTKTTVSAKAVTNIDSTGPVLQNYQQQTKISIKKEVVNDDDVSIDIDSMEEDHPVASALSIECNNIDSNKCCSCMCNKCQNTCSSSLSSTDVQNSCSNINNPSILLKLQKKINHDDSTNLQDILVDDVGTQEGIGKKWSLVLQQQQEQCSSNSYTLTTETDDSYMNSLSLSSSSFNWLAATAQDSFSLLMLQKQKDDKNDGTDSENDDDNDDTFSYNSTDALMDPDDDDDNDEDNGCEILSNAHEQINSNSNTEFQRKVHFGSITIREYCCHDHDDHADTDNHNIAFATTKQSIKQLYEDGNCESIKIRNMTSSLFSHYYNINNSKDVMNTDLGAADDNINDSCYDTIAVPTTEINLQHQAAVITPTATTIVSEVTFPCPDAYVHHKQIVQRLYKREQHQQQRQHYLKINRLNSCNDTKNCIVNDIFKPISSSSSSPSPPSLTTPTIIVSNCQQRKQQQKHHLHAIVGEAIHTSVATTTDNSTCSAYHRKDKSK
jgi:hypothetical protein